MQLQTNCMENHERIVNTMGPWVTHRMLKVVLSFITTLGGGNHRVQREVFSALPVEGLYCKSPIQCLASPELLTPQPFNPRGVCTPPPLVRGEDTLAGWGVNSSEDARHCSVLYICKYFVAFPIPSPPFPPLCVGEENG
jgi:hypothetical protein